VFSVAHTVYNMLTVRGNMCLLQINNAGCMNHERKLDTFGFESNFATNTLAVHILTKGLLPLIEQSSDPRVVRLCLCHILFNFHDLVGFVNCINNCVCTRIISLNCIIHEYSSVDSVFREIYLYTTV